MAEEYTYRGIYDDGEVGRIEDFLSQQRNMLNDEDAKQLDSAYYIKKYGIIVLGLASILIIIKLLPKKKK
jgi:hypothetical protein